MAFDLDGREKENTRQFYGEYFISKFGKNLNYGKTKL